MHSKCKEDDDDSAWIITWGYHNLFHGKISKSILDEICPSRPLLIWHRSFHEVYLNGKAMQAMEFENEEEITKHPQVIFLLSFNQFKSINDTLKYVKAQKALKNFMVIFNGHL